MPLDAVVSPYHLSSREPPAMVASLVCDRAVTFLPSPPSGDRESFTEAVAVVPRYRELLQSWEWCAQLWDRGVLCAQLDGRDPAQHVCRACDRMMSDSALELLRQLAHDRLFDSVQTYLDVISRDILCAGPNPGVSIPVVLGLDEFAFEHGLVAVRPEPASLIQRVEAGLAERLAVVAIPVIHQGDGRCVMEARDALADPLDDLRDAIDEALTAAIEGEYIEPEQRDARLRDSSRAYAHAFNEIRDELAHVPKDDEPRMVEGQVTLTLATLPRDAAITSALTAQRGLGRPTPDVQHDDEAAPIADERFGVMFVKPLGAGRVAP
ncbi:MAG: hypothetical protein IIC49_02975 [Planctomycetes bacterium]|nr:hypothetical protein [Planctomycetota bacterium]